MAARALAGLKAHERLSIGHYMLRRWSLEEDVRHLERLGFRSISLASTKLGAYGVERAIRLVRASALKVAHVGSYGWFGTERRTIRKGIEQPRGRRRRAPIATRTRVSFRRRRRPAFASPSR